MRVLFISMVAGGALLSGVGSINAQAIKLENSALDRVTASAASSVPNLPLEDEALWGRLTRAVVGIGGTTSNAETQSLTTSPTIDRSGTGSRQAIAAASDSLVGTTRSTSATTVKSASVTAGDSGSPLAGLRGFSSLSGSDLNRGPGNSTVTTQAFRSVMPGTRGVAAVTSRGSLSGQGMIAAPSISAFGSISGQR
jgi:hypothetical protein